MRIAIITEAATRESVETACAFVQMVDQYFLQALARRGTPLPSSLAALGIRYEREDRCYPTDPNEDAATCAEERFCTLGEMLRRARLGYGSDCDDIAPAHAALLVVSGRDPQARAVVIELAPESYHVIVRRGDGTLEDPCLSLGMQGFPGYPIPPAVLEPPWPLNPGPNGWRVAR